MKETQISVSNNGVFMFRTEWFGAADEERAKQVAVTIKLAMPLADVTLIQRDAVLSRSTVTLS